MACFSLQYLFFPLFQPILQPGMVSKPSGPRPAGQGRSKRRAPAPADHQVPDVVGQQAADPNQPGPSHVEHNPGRPPPPTSLGATGGSGGTTQTMPGTSSGQGRAAGKGTASKGAAKSSTQSSHSLPGHATTRPMAAAHGTARSRVETAASKGERTPRGASGGTSPQRGATAVSNGGHFTQRAAAVPLAGRSPPRGATAISSGGYSPPRRATAVSSGGHSPPRGATAISSGGHSPPRKATALSSGGHSTPRGAPAVSSGGHSPPRGTTAVSSGGHSPPRGATALSPRGASSVSQGAHSAQTQRGHASQRGATALSSSGGGAHGAGTARTSKVMSNSTRVDSHQEQLHHHHTHRPRDSKDQHQRQVHTLPANTMPPSASATASSSPTREVPTSSKRPKDPKERYVRQALQKQGVATLPHGGAAAACSSANSRGPHAYHHGTAPSSRPSGSANALSSSVASVHLPKHSISSRDTQSQRLHSSLSSLAAGTAASVIVESQTGTENSDSRERNRDRDIARITVDARTVVGLRTVRGGNHPGVSLGLQSAGQGQSVNNNASSSPQSQGQSSHKATASASTKKSPVDHPGNPHNSHHPIQPQTTRSNTRSRAPSPPRERQGGARATSNSPPLARGSLPGYDQHHRLQGGDRLPPVPVDIRNLRLDVVDYNHPDQGVGEGGASAAAPTASASAYSPSSNPILTNQLSAGISYGRPERPETTEALPDILNSHILPPYTVRQNQHRPSRSVNHRSGGGGGGGGRANVSRSRGRRSRGRRSSSGGGMTQLDDEEKGCCSHEGCLRCVTVLTTFRWVLVSLALLGVTCVVTGIVLGALHMTVGSSFLTLSLMFIGE